jgi:hypothetical protein
MRDLALEEIRERPLKDMDWALGREVRSGVLPVVADRGHTAQFLADRGVVLTNAARNVFLDFVLDNYIPALLQLQRLATRDYSPGELPKTFVYTTTSGALQPIVAPRTISFNRREVLFGVRTSEIKAATCRRRSFGWSADGS